jgi:predicted DNA-binding transcriptional regulator AlpA
MESNKREKMETDRKGLFDNLVRLDELLAHLRHAYSRKTVYAWVCKENGLPHKKIKGKLWFCLSEVDEWLERTS